MLIDDLLRISAENGKMIRKSRLRRNRREPRAAYKSAALRDFIVAYARRRMELTPEGNLKLLWLKLPE